MKRFRIAVLILLFIFSFYGCSASKIEVGTNAGVAYFHRAKSTPEVTRKGDSEVVIDSTDFYEKLVTAIDGKPAIADVCNCQAVYNVKIDQYSFGLHTHGITVSSPMGENIKGVNVFTVECTEEEMNEMFAILESVK